jgi:hypothetical protein
MALAVLDKREGQENGVTGSERKLSYLLEELGPPHMSELMATATTQEHSAG